MVESVRFSSHTCPTRGYGRRRYKAKLRLLSSVHADVILAITALVLSVTDRHSTRKLISVVAVVWAGCRGHPHVALAVSHARSALAAYMC